MSKAVDVELTPRKKQKEDEWKPRKKQKKDQEKPKKKDVGDSKDDFVDEIHIPLFVFLWTYNPCKLYGKLIPLFITHAMVLSAAGVFMCNAGYADVSCSLLGLIGFIIGYIGLVKIKMCGDVKMQSEKMWEELNLAKDVMKSYESENKLLHTTLYQLEDQCRDLKDERSKLASFNRELQTTTSEFSTGIQNFRSERKKLNQTYMEITTIVSSLGDKEVDLKNRCMVLRRELKKLRTHNSVIGKTYNSLVEEHEALRQTNDKLMAQLKLFDSIRQKYSDQREMLKTSMLGNLSGLKSTMKNYNIMFLQEIAHNAEFLDGQPGMTPEKFDEFLRRIPYNMSVPDEKLIMLFENLADENSICDHEAMHHIIIEIAKVNAGVPGALTRRGGIGAKMESAKVDL